MHWTEMVWQQAVSKMAFGNHKGVKIDAQVAKEDLFGSRFRKHCSRSTGR